MRLTKAIRSSIHRSILAGVPSIDYLAQLVPLVQSVLYEKMPQEVKAVYDNPELRGYLTTASVSVSKGTGTVQYLRAINSSGYLESIEFYGCVKPRLDINIEERVFAHLKEETLAHALVMAISTSKLFDKHLEQKELIENVKKRLTSTLESASSTKQLLLVLEPELHRFVPKDEKSIVNLPTTVAPVVGDLRKLGASLASI